MQSRSYNVRSTNSAGMQYLELRLFTSDPCLSSLLHRPGNPVLWYFFSVH